MKIKIKTLRGTLFEIDVKPDDIVADVKKNIETVLGPAVYPATQQMLIHQGEVLKDTTTLEENEVTENSFVVIMLSKSTNSASTSSAATNVAQPLTASQSAPSVTLRVETNVYVAVASYIVAGSCLGIIVQKMIERGGGRWDWETIIRIVLVAFNKPVRAIEYLYSGVPEQAEVQPQAKSLVDLLALNPAVGPNVNTLDLLLQGLLDMDFLTNSPQVEQTMNPPASSPQPVAPAVGPNANPLNIFQQELPNMGSNASCANTLDFLRNSAHFQSFRAVMQAHPQIFLLVFQDLREYNPNVMRWIRQHLTEFLMLLMEPLAGEWNFSRQIQLTGRVPDNFSLSPEEYRALRRLEGMGFTLSLALEVFLACNKNEVLAAFFLIGLRY